MVLTAVALVVLPLLASPAGAVDEACHAGGACPSKPPTLMQVRVKKHASETKAIDRNAARIEELKEELRREKELNRELQEEAGFAPGKVQWVPPVTVEDFEALMKPGDLNNDTVWNEEEYAKVKALHSKPPFDKVDSMVSKDGKITAEEIKKYWTENAIEEEANKEQKELEKEEKEHKFRPEDEDDEEEDKEDTKKEEALIEEDEEDEARMGGDEDPEFWKQVMTAAKATRNSQMSTEFVEKVASKLHARGKLHAEDILKRMHQHQEEHQDEEERLQATDKDDPFPNLLQRYAHLHRDGDYKVPSRHEGHLINVDMVSRVLLQIHDHQQVNHTLHHEIRRMVGMVRAPPPRVAVTACLRGITKMFGPGFCWRNSIVPVSPDCPKDYDSTPGFCVKKTCRRRNYYTDPLKVTCKTGCDDNRRRGWHDTLGMCYQKCDSPWVDVGITCEQSGFIYVKTKSRAVRPYREEVNHRLTYLSDKTKCPSSHPEKIAGLCYEKCGGKGMINGGPLACAQSTEIFVATIAEMVLNAMFAIVQTTSLVLTAGGATAPNLATAIFKNAAKKGIMKMVMKEYQKKALSIFTKKAFMNHLMKMSLNKACAGFSDGIWKGDFTPTVKDFDITGISNIADKCNGQCKPAHQVAMQCTQATLAAAGAFDPSGILSLAATFMQPKCASKNEMDKIIENNPQCGETTKKQSGPPLLGKCGGVTMSTLERCKGGETSGALRNHENGIASLQQCFLRVAATCSQAKYVSYSQHECRWYTSCSKDDDGGFNTVQIFPPPAAGAKDNDNNDDDNDNNDDNNNYYYND